MLMLRKDDERHRLTIPSDDQPPLQLVVQTDGRPEVVLYNRLMVKDDPAALARRFGHEHDLPEESYAVLKSSFVVP